MTSTNFSLFLPEFLNYFQPLNFRTPKCSSSKKPFRRDYEGFIIKTWATDRRHHHEKLHAALQIAIFIALDANRFGFLSSICCRCWEMQKCINSGTIYWPNNLKRQRTSLIFFTFFPSLRCSEIWYFFADIFRTRQKNIHRLKRITEF